MQSGAECLDLFVDILVRVLFLLVLVLYIALFPYGFSRIEALDYKKLTKIDRFIVSVTVGACSPIFNTPSAMNEIDVCEPLSNFKTGIICRD